MPASRVFIHWRVFPHSTVQGEVSEAAPGEQQNVFPPCPRAERKRGAAERQLSPVTQDVVPRAEFLFAKPPVGGATARSQVLAPNCLPSSTQLIAYIFLNKTLKTTRSGQKRGVASERSQRPGQRARAEPCGFVRAEEEFPPRGPYLASTGGTGGHG